MSILQYKEIEISDKSLVDEYFRQNPPEISEYTFNNLYLWRSYRRVFFAEYQGWLILMMRRGDKMCFLPPVGNGDLTAIYRTLLDDSHRDGIAAGFKRIPESHLEAVKTLPVRIQEDRDNFDYVYRAEDLIQLQGRKYDGKRGFIYKFYSQYDAQMHPYSDKWKDGCAELLNRWFAHKAKTSETVSPDGFTQDFEYTAIGEAFEVYDRLNMEGIVLAEGDRVVAFAFGEKLNPETFVVHFEKADTRYVGAYQTVNQELVKHSVFGKYEFVNREQDLGIEGIRKAKLSYYPARMVAKYIAINE